MGCYFDLDFGLILHANHVVLYGYHHLIWWVFLKDLFMYSIAMVHSFLLPKILT